MKATTNKLDPIERRMQRGRKIARTATMVVLLIVGVTAVIYPDIFSAQLNMPTEEEREEAKKQRKKNQTKKPKRSLSKLDVERLAKLREIRARKHMMEILRRLENRIIIAETKEAAVTAKFREDPKLFDSLGGLLRSHGEKVSSQGYSEVMDYMQRQKSGNSGSRSQLYALMNETRKFNYQLIQKYLRNPSPEALDQIIEHAKKVKKIAEDEQLVQIGFTVATQTMRYIQSIEDNATAIKTQDRDRAVRGFAQPEDHPLNAGQRKELDQTLSPMSMARLHQLSQEMATHYTNLMGDVDAGELAEVAKIPFPEALDKLAHQPFAEDDLQESLDQEIPENVDGLDDFTDALNEGEMSAERALGESGGEIPSKPGEGKPGEGEGEGEGKDGEGGDKSGDAEDGEGNFGSGGGNGTENSNRQGPPTSPGQMTKEQILRSLALKSSLNAEQNRSRQITVDKKKVLANVLPGRRFTADRPRKGYLFIDTWHIIGPWDAQASRNRKIDFSRIYPLERKINLDAIYTTGKTKCIYDDERGYGGKKTMTGRLTWKFYQSPTVEIRIPREQLANDALYFAYTEVYFEQASTMNLAIASDDAARIRVNGNIVFEDTGLSPYVISEQVRQVKFKQGVNKILVRLVNGPGPCRFSLLLTPKVKK